MSRLLRAAVKSRRPDTRLTGTEWKNKDAIFALTFRVFL